MSLTEFSIKRPLFITVIFACLLLFGYLSYRSLNYNLLPKFETNMISITTSYSGASAEEVQTSVTKPIEDAVAAIEGVDRVSSSSQEGASSVSVELTNDADVKQAQLDAERKINQIKSSLPDNADDPVVSRFSTDDQAIMKISLTSSLSDTKLYDFVDNELKPQLTNIPGVAQVDITGGIEQQINVMLDNDKLKAYNLSISEVNQAVVYSGATYPAGSLSDNQTRYSIDLNAKVSSPEELKQVIVRQNQDGSRVLLSDVASVTDGHEEESTLNRLNGRPAIGIEIKKQSDANTVKVCQLAAKKLETLKQTYADNHLQYHIASDQSIYTLESADAVIEDIFLAIVIVALVMLFFLHSLRSSSFVLVALPSAMVPTFILMWAFKFSLNMMTLMSLSLVVGILVDDSIVVLENIYRHLEMGKDKRSAAIDGRKEIGFTAIAITLVDVVVFLPLALAGGIIGNIVKEYALVVVFSTLLSLFVAFTLTPLLASRWGKLSHFTNDTVWGRVNGWFESLINQLREFYVTILNWSLTHKRYIIIFITFLIIGTIALVPAGFVGAEFMEQSDRGELNIQLDLASQSSLKQTNQVVSQVEELILKHPEVKDVFSNVGSQSGASIGSNASNNSNLAEVTVTLVDKKERKIKTEDFGKLLREEINTVPGVKPTIKLTGITGNASYGVQMAVKGNNRDSISKAAAIVKQIVAGTAGADYVQYSTKEAKTQISIQLDRDKMSQLGVSVENVGTAIQYSFKGNDNTKYREGGQEYNINLQMDNADRSNISNVRNLNIYNDRGGIVPLNEIAVIKEIQMQGVLERKDRMNSMEIDAATVGRPAGSIMEEIKAKLAKVKLPAGVEVSEEGMNKNQTDSFKNLFLAIGIGILLMYMIMVALYESVVYPFVVLFSLPVALIGAILALALTLKTINIFSLLGIILLLGLVAKNAILIVDFANQQKGEGLPVKNALIEAGKERLRPILMTTLAMIFGMLPMALSTGAGSETKGSMAWVIIGGLTSSMMFTLILVPCVYMIIEGWRVRVNKLFSKK